MSAERVERRLAAVLAADVAGYSRLMEADEEGTLSALRMIRRDLGDPKIAEHRGRIVKTSGDGLLVQFASVVDAVRCAVELQRGIAEHNAAVAQDKRIEFRIGIHQGDIIAEDGNIFGDGVNLAARLEGLAEPGGICVSGVVRHEIRDKLDVGFEDLGEQQVKNISRPVRVYRVSIADTATPKTPLPLPDKPSLAVLPFQNLSGDPEQEYFVDGVVEEIITAISRLPWLFVIARNSSFAYKGKSPDLRQVGRELGVRYVLEGSLRKAGNRVRITGQLIDTITGAHIWADRFDGSLDDIFELQDEVASNVVGAIEPRLRQSEIECARRKPTQNLNAYDLYLRTLALQRAFTADALAEALDLSRRALTIDPEYAPAAALAAWCILFATVQVWLSPEQRQLEEAVRLARQALQTGRDDPDCVWMAAYTLMLAHGEHAAVATIVDRALSLNPNSAHAWATCGWIHGFSGRASQAIEAHERAIRLSPRDPLAFLLFKGGLAFAHMIAGRYDEGLDYARQGLIEQPRSIALLRIKAALCGHAGRVEEGREAIERLLELHPGMTLAHYANSASVYVQPKPWAIYTEGLRNAGMPE
jgi:adenylate cyclase